MDITLADLVLLIWSAVATTVAGAYRARCVVMERMMRDGAMRVYRMLWDDKYREKMRQQLCEVKESEK